MDRETTFGPDDILEDALDVAPELLDAFLDNRCRGNAGMREEVARLLAANRRMNGNFLEGTAARWAVPKLELGQKLGRYEIEGEIASGGMSVVYRGQDLGIGRAVAIKVLKPSSGIGTKSDSRFFSEVQILGSIRHPNVVQIFDFGDLDGVYYIVMEYLDGRDLAQVIAAGECGDLAWKLEVARQLGAALQHIHRLGIIHRDVKPANVFIEPSGVVKLMDFGISRLDGPGSNQTTSLAGTLEYLSPEQVRGESPSHRSDIYSYGIVLFELFTGHKAFIGNTAEVLYRIAHEEIPLDALRISDLPRSLAALIRSTTRKNPAERPASFDDILLAIVAIHAGKSATSGLRVPWGRKAIFAAALMTLSVVGIGIRLANPSGTTSPKTGAHIVSRPAFKPVRPQADALADRRENGRVLRGWMGRRCR